MASGRDLTAGRAIGAQTATKHKIYGAEDPIPYLPRATPYDAVHTAMPRAESPHGPTYSLRSPLHE